MGSFMAANNPVFNSIWVFQAAFFCEALVTFLELKGV